MLKFEFEDAFHDIHDKAAAYNPVLDSVTVYMHPYATENKLALQKGINEDSNKYILHSRIDRDDPKTTCLYFAFGLTLIIYDLKYGEYKFELLSEEEKSIFYAIMEEFYPPAKVLRIREG